MAQLDVEPKKNNDMWKWIVGILAAIVIIWVIVEATGPDDAMDDMEMETTTDPATSFIETDAKYTFS